MKVNGNSSYKWAGFFFLFFQLYTARTKAALQESASGARSCAETKRDRLIGQAFMIQIIKGKEINIWLQEQHNQTTVKLVSDLFSEFRRHLSLLVALGK